jgi:hypothetical protein
VREFRKLLVKCFDSNGNGKLEASEILYPLIVFFVIDIIAGTVSNFFYDFIKRIFQ